MKKLLIALVVVLALGVVAAPAAAEPPSTAPGFDIAWWPLVVDGTYYLNCTPAEGTTSFTGVEATMTPPHVVFFDVNGTGVFVWKGQEFYYDAALTMPALHAGGSPGELPYDLWATNPGKAANAWMSGKITTEYGNPPDPGYWPDGSEWPYLYFKLYGVWTAK